MRIENGDSVTGKKGGEKSKRRLERFTKQEAEGKVGKVIQLREHFPSIARGNTGKVVKADSLGGDEWDIMIRWDFPEEETPVVFWLTKDEYKRFLEEL